MRWLVGLADLHVPWEFRVQSPCRDVPQKLVLTVLDLPYEEILFYLTTNAVINEEANSILGMANIGMGFVRLSTGSDVAQVRRDLRWFRRCRCRHSSLASCSASVAGLKAQ